MPVEIREQVSDIIAGGNGSNGDLILRNNSGANRIHLDAGAGAGHFGGNGNDGNLALYARGGDNQTIDQATIRLNGQGGVLLVGGGGGNGDVVVKGAEGQDRIRLTAASAALWVGGNGNDGDIVLFAAGGDNETLEQGTIRLNGASGDIILQNADCAEDFEAHNADGLEPGTVLAVADDSRLTISAVAYDRRVAGVVAGAGDQRPGIILGRDKCVPQRVPVALIGRVCCKVDATPGSVSVGDLLTTSDRPGFAMKAADSRRAFGAVIGKALQPLSAGTGIIPILVALQ